MDIFKLLRAKFEEIPKGDHVAGLQAIIAHVEVAIDRWQRGHKEKDNSFFTDVIYRCNQAFEGSIKEAYRVIAQKDPDKKNISQIEDYLLNEKALRERVLSQLKSYRQEWRNPSTHNYKLDFDQNEALIAITSVSAFAIVLIDQISVKLSFDAKKAAVPSRSNIVGKNDPFEQVTSLVCSFANEQGRSIGAGEGFIESSLVGALGGFLAGQLGDDAIVMLETSLSGMNSSTFEADIVVIFDSKSIIIEISRDSTSLRRDIHVSMINAFMNNSTEVQGAVVLFFSPQNDVHYLPKPAKTFDNINVISAG